MSGVVKALQRMTCEFPGCGRKHLAKGRCHAHNEQWRRVGRLIPIGSGQQLTPPAERFAQLTIPEPNTGCLLWLGAIASSGYGKFGVSHKTVSAHRVAWDLVHGSIPGGLEIRHSCDTKLCVNVDHMSLGTHAENMADMYARGRAPSQKRKVHDEEAG